MSQFKFKCREVLVKLSPTAKRLKDREARKRFYDLEYVCFSQLSVRDACLKQGISEDYFRKWAKRLVLNPELKTLKSLSRKPRRSPNKTRKNVVEIIKTVREEKPFLGPARIFDKIKEVFPKRKTPSESTVLRVLKREGMISKAI